VNLACKKDDGTIWIDAMALNVASGALSAVSATPTAADADVDEWSVTMWGRTIPNRTTNPSNRGT
jgi:hypothetical protein